MSGRGADPGVDDQSPDGPLRAELTITNKRGLHARASSKLVKLVEAHDARVLVSKDGTCVSGTSIMGLMPLAAGPGSTVSVEVEGQQARQVLDAIMALVADRFGEGE